MNAEYWELRREARRCTYAAIQAETTRCERMMLGYARFYETLAESAEESDPFSTDAPRGGAMKMPPRRVPERLTACTV